MSKVKNEYKSQYYKYTELNKLGIDSGPFDFQSIMMYPSKSGFCYSNTDSIAFTKINGDLVYTQRYYLSNHDVNSINWLYAGSSELGYAKLVQERTIITEDITQTYDEIEESISNTIYFYSDENLTTPMTLNFKRYVTLRFLEADINNSTISNHVIEVPAGVSFYTLPDTYFHMVNEYGNQTEYSETRYELGGIGW